MQNNPAVISERNIPKLNIIGCRFYVGAVPVDIVYILQRFQLFMAESTTPSIWAASLIFSTLPNITKENRTNIRKNAILICP